MPRKLPSHNNQDEILEHPARVSNGEDAPPPAVSLEGRLHDPKTIISFLAAFAILFFVFSRMNVDVGEIVRNIRQANIVLYVLALVVYYCSFPLRAWRWRVLLSNVGYRREDGDRLPGLFGLSEMIFLSWFANCIVPAKLGDAYRGYLLKGRSDVSFSRTMGTVLAERIFDMIALFVLMVASGVMLFGAHMPGAVEYLFVVGLAFVLLIAAVLLLMKRYGRHLERRLPTRIRGLYARFEEGTLGSFRRIPAVTFATIGVWAIETARLWLIIAALGLLNVSVPVVIFTSLAASLLTTLPVTPAGLGLVESGMVAILVFMNSLGTVQGLTQSGATTIALLDRTISYWSIVFFGALAYVVTRKR